MGEEENDISVFINEQRVDIKIKDGLSKVW